jgi:predicted DNA-binding transcriptional regulator YafY
MRASRLLSILMVLQARGRTTAEVLAAQFEVSVRTIYRDIEQLSAAGVPVYADRGRNGGFDLLDGYRTRLTGLSPDEAAALFLSGLPGPAAELGLADLMTTAQLKLTAALPEGARATAKRVASRFHLDPVGWFQGAADARLLPALADAAWNDKRVELRYRRWNDSVTRKVLPLGLVLKGGVWYLVAQTGEQARTYKVAHIEQLKVLEDRFQRPKDFNLSQFWTAATHAYEAGLYRLKAELRISPTGLKKLEMLGSAVAQAAAASAREPDSDGWMRVTIPIESINHATFELARLGFDIEVLKPRDLRRSMAEAARNLLALYGAN